MRAPSTSASVTAMTTGVSDISALRNSSSSNSPSFPGEALLRTKLTSVLGVRPRMTKGVESVAGFRGNAPQSNHAHVECPL